MSHKPEISNWAKEVYDSYCFQIAEDVYPPLLEDELLWATPGTNEAGQNSEEQLAELDLCTIADAPCPGVILWPLIDGEPLQISDSQYRAIVESHLKAQGLNASSIDFIVKSAGPKDRMAGIENYALRELIQIDKHRRTDHKT